MSALTKLIALFGLSVVLKLLGDWLLRSAEYVETFHQLITAN